MERLCHLDSDRRAGNSSLKCTAWEQQPPTRLDDPSGFLKVRDADIAAFSPGQHIDSPSANLVAGSSTSS